MTQVFIFPAQPDNQNFGGATRGRGWDVILSSAFYNSLVYAKNGAGPGNSSVMYYRPPVGSIPSLTVAMVLNKDLGTLRYEEFPPDGSGKNAWNYGNFWYMVETIVHNMDPVDLPTTDLLEQSLWAKLSPQP
jgi:hypothetical protein